MKIDYETFLKQKEVFDSPSGFSVQAINDKLFDWQSAITKWALRRGRACLFEDCGLGKTPQQLVWADEVRRKAGDVLILAPLAVATQTVKEGVKFGIELEYSRTGEKSKTGITIANYEMLSHFSPDDYSGIVLDESSILKSFAGKVRRNPVSLFLQCRHRVTGRRHGGITDQRRGRAKFGHNLRGDIRTMSWTEYTPSIVTANAMSLNPMLAVLRLAEPSQNPVLTTMASYIKLKGAKFFYYTDATTDKVALIMKWMPDPQNIYRVSLGYSGSNPTNGVKLAVTKIRDFMDTNSVTNITAIVPKVMGNAISDSFNVLIPKMVWEWSLAEDIPNNWIWNFYRDPARRGEDLLWVGPNP